MSPIGTLVTVLIAGAVAAALLRLAADGTPHLPGSAWTVSPAAARRPQPLARTHHPHGSARPVALVRATRRWGTAALYRGAAPCPIGRGQAATPRFHRVSAAQS